jgi:branched-chain amino acid transport system substrate-binding protein
MFLPIEYVSVEAVSGLLLAVVFYHLNLIDRLPKTVGYTVLLDYAFYVVYALLILQLLIIVLAHSKRIKASGIEASHLISWGRIVFPSIIGVSTIYLGWVVFQSSI